MSLAHRAGERCLLVAPHQDDETIGAGVWMHRKGEGLNILHLTDGSPADMADATAHGFTSREAYAEARRKELRAALSDLNLSDDQYREFGFVDKTLYLHLPELITRIRATLEEIRPSLVLSPAYEGGHPDHDSAAFAIAVARRQAGWDFAHREYRLYHAGSNGQIDAGRFLPAITSHVDILRFSSRERELKRRMVQCFVTQADVLRSFELNDEQFRDAPSYDFLRPPHEGPLLYELWEWGVSGAEWRRKASEALDAAFTSRR